MQQTRKAHWRIARLSLLRGALLSAGLLSVLNSNLVFAQAENQAIIPVDVKAPAEAKSILKAKVSTWRESTDHGSPVDDFTLSANFPDRAWWNQFDDSYLSGYITEALMNNHDLKVASAKVKEAEALARQSLGKELPSLSLGATFSRNRSSANSIPRFNSANSSSGSGFGTGSSGNTGSSGGSSSFLLGQYINSYSFPLSAAYEPDFWQKNRDKTRSLAMTTVALKKDAQTAAVLLATNVANSYFNLMAADELITLQNQRIALSQSNLNFATHRVDLGVASEEELAIRQGIVVAEKARLQSVNAQRSLALNSLALLLGRTTQQVEGLAHKSFSDYQLSSAVETGVPSQLLLRRPDILAAEDRLAAAKIDVSVARKEFLPTFTLTGQFGFASAGYSRLFQWDSYLASVIAGATQTLFTGGQKVANLKVYKARYEQAVHHYQQTILQSFKDVDDSLAMYKADRRSYADYQDSLKTYESRIEILNNRIQAGVNSEADLVPVQLEAANTRSQLTQAKLAALNDTLSLYKSIGGGY